MSRASASAAAVEIGAHAAEAGHAAQQAVAGELLVHAQHRSLRRIACTLAVTNATSVQMAPMSATWL